ncbi:hypothetical protein TrispH2_004668 [Trichoplax sp. H2]|nr:hypothetical protein TrispH2_004668 [Trichoplax sp. H2]|eukprot:RDD44214.1 hypothetical protein TrispH2_004668 [Trichoplax sp. H2]
MADEPFDSWEEAAESQRRLLQYYRLISCCTKSVIKNDRNGMFLP